MSDRGMKKYAPFASLIEQKGYLRRMMEEKKKIVRPQISTDMAQEIELVLNTHQGKPIKAIYFENGFLIQTEGTISNINELSKTLTIENRVVSFSNLISINFK